MRVAYETSPTILHASEPKLAAPFAFSAIERRAKVSDSATIVRRLLATFTTRDDEGSDLESMSSVNYWQFRVVGDPSYWLLGGRLAIVQKDTGDDACGGADGGGCDLTACKHKAVTPSEALVRGCVFTLKLQPGASYTIAFFGVSDKSPAAGAAISVQFKPPGNCVLKVGCDNPVALEGVCRSYAADTMPWQPVKQGAMPRFDCSAAAPATVAAIHVETKPYCIAPGLYSDGDVADCWPGVAPPPRAPGGVSGGGGGAGCAGEYHVGMAAWQIHVFITSFIELDELHGA